jgi:NADH:ubiquinone oxidoreductase subunit K
VLVYLGAVMVLFLFVVMMLDINIEGRAPGFLEAFPAGRHMGALIALEMAAVLMGGFRGMEEPKAARCCAGCGGQVVQYSNTKALGKLLYTKYLYPVEIAAVILLVAMIAAIALTLRSARTASHQSVAAGACACRDRLTVVKMAATRQAPAPEPAPMLPRRRKHDALTLGHFLTLGAMLFALAVVGIFLNRKNLIVLLMAIELMLLAVNMNFVAFSHYLGDMHGQVFVFFILTVAAAESAIGLAILVLLFRNKSSINADELNTLKG